MLYTILLLFAWPFDHFALLSILKYYSARYRLSGQVTKVSLRQSDSLIAIYPLVVLLLVCQTSLPLGYVKIILSIGGTLSYSCKDIAKLLSTLNANMLF